jgi:hypothetical protein
VFNDTPTFKFYLGFVAGVSHSLRISVQANSSVIVNIQIIGRGAEATRKLQNEEKVLNLTQKAFAV